MRTNHRINQTSYEVRIPIDGWYGLSVSVEGKQYQWIGSMYYKDAYINHKELGKLCLTQDYAYYVDYL